MGIVTRAAGNGRASTPCNPASRTTSASTSTGPTTGVGGQRPNAIAAPVEPRDLGCWFYTSSNSTCRALLPNQTDAFLLPAQFTYGNAGRNIFYGDRLVQFDMSLIKNFRLTESKSPRFPRTGI